MHWDLVHRHGRRQWAAWLQASRMHWTGWHEARRVHRAGVLDWHRTRMHGGLMQLAIGLEVQVEAALASLLGGVSLPRGWRLLDLDALDVHIGLWRSLCPVVGVLAHRVVCWREIIKSEGVLPGRREEKTKDLILRKHERQTEGGGGCGCGCGRLCEDRAGGRWSEWRSGYEAADDRPFTSSSDGAGESWN